jgi:holo-[acyl-carrier protein] synthase
LIAGIGTDIIEVERIQRLLQKDEAFKLKVFTEIEINYCESKKNKAESYASRFAAKEAMFKAMGTGWRGEMKFTDIEVYNDELGKPFVRTYGAVSEFLSQKNIQIIHISMSHIKSMGIATILLETPS